MQVQILRVQSHNLSVLERVDPDCFDEPIDLERAARCVESPDAVLLVAVGEGVVIGQCLAAIHRHPDKASEVYIDDLAVSPSFQRRGIATQLVEMCIGYGRAAGATIVWVATETTNDAARQFYRSCRLEESTVVMFERSLPRDDSAA
jgi:ribosomal protein S18 acetylase RimI-like enzyme